VSDGLGARIVVGTALPDKAPAGRVVGPLRFVPAIDSSSVAECPASGIVRPGTLASIGRNSRPVVFQDAWAARPDCFPETSCRAGVSDGAGDGAGRCTMTVGCDVEAVAAANAASRF
jgi:hypothetical protein